MEHVPVAVVGAGQAGLATSYWLSTYDIEHVLFDPAEPGDSWRARWDSFTLVTPNWCLDLPGHSYSGDHPEGFLARDVVVDYVRSFAEAISPTILPHRILSMSRDGRWKLASRNETWTADSVVVATGAYPHPSVPSLSSELPDGIRQLHSQQYRNPEQLPGGAVLVVGSGQSGAQIVDDLRIAGRDVWLAAGTAGVAPRRYRGRDIVEWLGDMGFFESPATDESRHAASVMVSGRDGGKTLDLRSFGEAGVRLLGRVMGAEDAVVSFAPGLAETILASEAIGVELAAAIDDYIHEHGLESPDPDWVVSQWEPPADTTVVDLGREHITSVVWATGYEYDYAWIEGVRVDRLGYPEQSRGVTDLPGLYFVGLNQMYTIGSSLFKGVGNDAAHVVGHLKRHAETPT